MAVIKAKYGTRTELAFTGALYSLANAGVASSSVVDNSTALATDYLIETFIDGTAATNAFVEYRIAPSENNVNFGSFESSIPLGIVDLSVDMQRTAWSVCGHGGFAVCPQYFKIWVKNRTGATLSGAGGISSSCWYQSVNTEIV